MKPIKKAPGKERKEISKRPGKDKCLKVEFTFNTYRFLPGSLRVELWVKGANVATMAVPEKGWLDAETRNDLMTEIGEWYINKYVKGGRQNGK